jgi:hypothetical protein
MAARSRTTGTDRMARASLACLLVCFLFSACDTATRRVALNTSDGQGNVVGLGEYKLGSNESELDKAGWAFYEFPKSNQYMKDIQVAIGGKLRNGRARLLFNEGKELRFISFAFTYETSDAEVYSALAAEYGAAFPKDKHKLTASYRHTDPQGNVIDLGETRGKPQIIFHWKAK